MIARLLQFIEPEFLRVHRKRRLEQVAIHAGASRQIAKRIVALYFAAPKRGCE